MIINCRNRSCPKNQKHPSGIGYTCSDTITSITPEGKCELWGTIQTKENIAAKKELDAIRTELNNQGYQDQMADNRERHY